MAEIREGYKETEIGIIPEDWEVKKLGEVADVKGGKRIPKGFTLVDEDTGYPYIRVADMNNGGVSLNDIKYVPIEVVEKISKYRISSKDIYISVAGTLGIVGVIPEALENANLTENADKICDIKCNRDFLAYFLRGKYIQKIIDNEKTLGAQPKLALTRIKTFNIALPPIKEQKKIAEILSTTDKHIEDLDRLIEDYELLKKGMMQKLLTEGIGHTEFKDTEIGRIPNEWKKVELDDCIELLTGAPFKSKLFNTHGIGIPIIRIRDLVESNISTYYSGDYDKEYLINRDDILVGMDGDFHVTKWKNINSLLNQRVLKISSRNADKLDNSFLYFFIQPIISDIQKKTPATTVKHLSTKDIRKLKVYLPQVSEQIQIASILESFEERINSFRIQADDFKNLKQALMDRLLTGKIRVV